jgi:branched-chain amino acid transport system ATP-binding protein
VARIFDLILELSGEGITILLVEQNAVQALDIADRGYVLQMGKFVMFGNAKDLASSDVVRKAYLVS